MELHLWQITNPLFAVVVSLLVGGGLACVEYIYKQTTPRWLLVVVAIPLFLPQPIVGTIIIVWFGKLGVLYQPASVLIGYLYYNIPLAYLLTYQALQSLPRNLTNTLMLFGASRWQQFYYAVWPATRPSILQTAALIFLYCFTSFSLPLMLGGFTAGTIEVAIYQQWVIYHQPIAALSLAAIQTAGLLIVIYPVLRNHQPIANHQLLAQSMHTTWAFKLLHLAIGLLYTGSLFVLVKQLHPLTQTTFWPAAVYTVLLGSVISMCAVAISYTLRNYSRLVLLLLCFSPVSISLVLSIYLGKSVWAQGLVLCLSALPVITLVVSDRWQSRPAHFDDTLTLLGASPWQRLQLNLGWLRPALQFGLAIGIAYTLGDAAIASMLAPTTWPSAMQVALQLLGSYRFQFAASAMVYVILFTGFIYLLAYARRTSSY